MTPKAIENPSQLLDWLEARGQRFIVFSVGDAKRMALDYQMMLIWLHTRAVGDPPELVTDATRPDADAISAKLKSVAREGYILLPVAELRKLDMPSLASLQDLTYAYREVREAQWFPVEKKPCGCKGGCDTCQHTGQVEVLVEMSAHERKLAENGYT